LAVPLYVESLPTVVGALPAELSQHLEVQYIGDHAWLRFAPELLVSIPDLRAAFSWLLSHNWYWLETTLAISRRPLIPWAHNSKNSCRHTPRI
jgi:hypothetical protein